MVDPLYTALDPTHFVLKILFTFVAKQAIFMLINLTDPSRFTQCFVIYSNQAISVLFNVCG
jgi:hypothetical protein